MKQTKTVYKYQVVYTTANDPEEVMVVEVGKMPEAQKWAAHFQDSFTDRVYSIKTVKDKV